MPKKPNQMAYIGEVIQVVDLGANKFKYWVQLPDVEGDPYSGRKVWAVGTGTNYKVGSSIKVGLSDQGWQIRR